MGSPRNQNGEGRKKGRLARLGVVMLWWDETTCLFVGWNDRVLFATPTYILGQAFGKGFNHKLVELTMFVNDTVLGRLSEVFESSVTDQDM